MKNEVKVKEDYIDENGFYVIENYDKKLTFSSFLSAIAGIHGTPMWTFYVNRGQCISSIGIKDKENCIMEFFPANEAYKMVYTNGFRTFLRLVNNNEVTVVEPFSVETNKKIQRNIMIKNNELRLIEVNNELNLNIEINYFTIPNESFAALGRKIKVTNNRGVKVNFEILDGLTSILPYGSENSSYKEVGNTLRSWMEGEVKENNTAVFKVRASTGDTTKVDKIENSYFYVGFNSTGKVLKPIVDPENIFGVDTSLSEAIEFERLGLSNLYINNISYNKVPCGFVGEEVYLEPGDSKEIYSYIGYMENSSEVDERLKEICNIEYFNNKVLVGNNIIDDLNNHVYTKTNYSLFDEYIKQCHIDNLLRGGYPLEIGGADKKIYYVYSRKHGDLERDYNFFSIEPNFYSQGNGNFRDINQNRRMDPYIHPFIGKENIKLFSDLIQLDGYNPLVVKGKKFIIKDQNYKEAIKNFDKKTIEAISEILEGKFTIGELYSALIKIAKLTEKNAMFVMNFIIDLCSEEVEADFGEGFWVDHWTYNLDLIEQYLDIYPDKVKELLIDEKIYKFYNSPEYVLPRKDKYILDDGKVRQYLSLAKKKKLSNNWVYTEDGELYKTSLLTKLVMLAGIKFMTLDEYGIGIEMEAGKPGWNDAMNGLPGLLGSSFAETAELKRLLLFINENIDITEKIDVPEEFYNCLVEVYKNLHCDLSDLEYWNKISDLRENYREETKYSISGKEVSISKGELKDILEKMISKIDLGIEKAKELNDGKIPTFIYYNVTKYEEDESKGIKPLEFKINFLPSFLEGPTRYLKTKLSHEEKVKLYDEIKESDIYDKKLKMYKTSESLEDEGFEIGRVRGFTAGWLERESVFMHMEFKYILELIKNGLYDEFFEDIKTVMPPFMDPKVYGRSVLENSSFIASSSNPDERVHGRGFVARLSGTTVEVLNIWKLMMVGPKLFTYEDNKLKFSLNPILTKDFFKEGIVETTILGRIKLVYSNENNKNTFGENKGEITEIILIDKDNTITTINGDKVIGDLAIKIRSCEVKEIRVKIL